MWLIVGGYLINCCEEDNVWGCYWAATIRTQGSVGINPSSTNLSSLENAQSGVMAHSSIAGTSDVDRGMLEIDECRWI